MTDVLARSSRPALSDLSVALLLATTCRDGAFPWQPDAPVAGRGATLNNALAALPNSDFAGFGRFAAHLGDAYACQAWPAPSGGAAPVPGALPDVPVLGISGGIDMRTPTEDARKVLAQFPQGKLVVDPGTGHNPTGADLSNGCLQLAVLNWVNGAGANQTCPRRKTPISIQAAYPSAPRSRLNASATRTMALKTLRDAGTINAVAIDAGASKGFAIAGLAGGKLTVTDDGFTLTRFAMVPGVTISGKIKTDDGPPAVWSGRLTVRGRLATRGELTAKTS